MSGRPKFSVSQDWVQPSLSQKTNGDGLRSHSSPHGDEADEQQSNIKLAGFFALVALLCVLAEHLGHIQERTDANLAPDSTALVSLTLLPAKGSVNPVGFSMRFRLSNRGNHSVFYPISTATNELMGQLVMRTSPSSDWMSLSNTSNQPVAAVEEFMNSGFTWIEMPPGGWVNGEFPDAGEFRGEHAYAIFLKPSRNAGTVRILSEPYGSGRK